MSDKYIMALYTHCLVARKEATIQGVQVEGFTEKEHEMVRLKSVGGCFVLGITVGNVDFENRKIQADMCAVMKID